MVKYRLPNGLVVILLPIESAVSLSVGLWVKTGSRHELPAQFGYAHFVEHMLFKGTSNRSAKEIAQMVDRVGGQHNAATNREYTCFYVNVMSDYADLSLSLLSDMYYNSLFDKAEIEKEIGVVLEEINMYEDTPDDLIHDVFMDSILGGHPLGHPILGYKNTIEGITRDSILEYYDSHYTNDNSVLVVAGKFEENALRALVEKHYSAERNQKSKIELPPSTIKKTLRKHVERDLEQIHLTLGFDGLVKHDEDRWALYLLSTILGGSMSSRLFQRVRESEGLCYSVYSFHSSYADNGVAGVYCGTSPEKYARAMDLIIEECQKIYKEPITAQELQDSKNFMKGNLALSLESIEVRMGQLARNEIMFGRNYEFDEIVRLVDSVKIDDFVRVAEKIFKNKTGVLATVGKIPSGQDTYNEVTL
jgi:predicted Zn-dependent peptidase